MQIQCHAAILVEQDEPVPAVRQFVRILKNCAVEASRAEVNLNLIATSARGKTVVQEFRPERTRGARFEQALAITEELTALGTAKIKSLHFLLSAEGFRWKGSREGTSAQVSLLDGKSLQRKRRFDLLALLSFEAADASEPFIGKMLAEIAKATGIRFQLESSLMRVGKGEQGRATPEELFVTTLVWTELIERIGEKVRKEISLAGVPHLMTTSEAHAFLFHPRKLGKSVRVDFTRITRKWLKEEFPDYARSTGALDGEMLQKEIADGVVAEVSIDKRGKAFSKEFTIGVGVGLTSPRFAPTQDRPFRLAVNVFRLFGIWPLPMQWTYHTEADLREALKGAALLLHRVVAIFEPETALMRKASERRIEEFEGPREVSAKEAYVLARPIVKAWAGDAGLLRITSNMISAPYLSSFPVVLPVTNGKGRLAKNGGWWMQFHSRTKHENLYVTVPCHGPVTQTRLDAPAGRHWPSDVDQILRDGWMDSDEAARAALAAAQEKDAADSNTEGQFELSSRANVLAAKVLGLPMRDDMFEITAAWRISFSRMNEKERRITSVSVPAHGGGAPVVEMHVYDKHGRSIPG